MSQIKISNSEIQTYKDCKRKWWLTYYRELGLVVEDLTGARKLGTNVHTVLGDWYQDGVDPVNGIITIYAEQIKAVEAAGQDAAKLRKDADLALAMIEGYLQWVDETGQDVDLELVGTEQVIEYPIEVIGHEVLLRGKLDARFDRKSDGARVFLDHKTVQSIDQMSRILPQNEQMKFYHLLEHLALGPAQEKRTDGALFNMLRKVKRTAAAKPPFFDRLHVQHNRAVLESTWKRVIGTITEMMLTREALDAGEDHQVVCPPRPNMDCTWKCDFQPICAMFDDGSNVEGLMTEYYSHIDPHERYNDESEKGGAE